MTTATRPTRVKPDIAEATGLRITVTRSALLEGLDAAASASPTTSSLDVLKCVLLDATPDGLLVTGTSFDFTVRKTVPADTQQTGRLAVPAARLLAIAKDLPEGPVSLHADGNNCRVESGRTRIRVGGTDPDEFPVFRDDLGAPWTMSAADLHAMAIRVAPAASTEPSRPIVNGVQWKATTAGFSATASDSTFGLATLCFPGVVGPDRELIVPASTLATLRSLLPAEGVLSLATDAGSRTLVVTAESLAVRSVLIEGPYPPWERIVPVDPPTVVTTDRAALVTAIRRLSSVTDGDLRPVALAFSADAVTLSVRSTDIGEGTDVLPAARECGDDIRIGFNGKKLSEILKRMPADTVRLSLSAPLSPILITPVGGSSAPEYRAVAMPLRLAD